MYNTLTLYLVGIIFSSNKELEKDAECVYIYEFNLTKFRLLYFGHIN